MKRVYSLLVDNNPGVLSRISGLFSRRGYSIDSITAGVTADPRFTRITIVASGDELILSQIEKQVRKLEDVIEIKVLDPRGPGRESRDHLSGGYFPCKNRRRGEGVSDRGADRNPVQAGCFLKPAGGI